MDVDERRRRKPHVTQADIRRGLSALGIGVGDVVMLHSALSSFGYVEGGAGAVIDAFLQPIGDGGTLVVPSYPGSGWMYDSIRSDPLFDMRTVPTKAGRIAETLRLRPEARRSLEPWGAVAAIGADAAYITRDEPDSDDGCGALSPWLKVVELNAQVTMAGVGFGNCTLMHTVESLAGAPYSLTEEALPYRMIDPEGVVVTRHQRSHTKGAPRDYTLIEPVLVERGLLRREMIGRSEVRVVRARDLVETGLELLAADPYWLLTVGRWSPEGE